MKATELQKQFAKWAKHLLKVNPDYVRNPERLRGYLQTPNWDGDHWEYAHYRDYIRNGYPELLPVFERMRESQGDEGLAEYRRLLKDAGIKEVA